MAIISGSTTVLKSAPGVAASKAVTISGLSSSSKAVAFPAQKVSPTDPRGPMEFYAECSTNTLTILSQRSELYADTLVFYFVDTDGSGSDVVGLLDFKGSIDASTNPNYPAAELGDSYIVTVAGKVGGASGKDVQAGDFLIANADNAGGSEAAVGTSWDVLEGNKQPASETVAGFIEIATQGEVDAGSDDARAITPLKLASSVLAGDVVTAQSTADNAQADITAHEALNNNPHSVTKAQVLTGDLIVNADVDNAAAIAESKLALDYATATLNTNQTNHEGNVLNAHMSASPQDLSGPGAVDLVSSTTWISTTGIDAFTLADGAEGQHKYIVMKADSGDGTLTPTNLGNGSTITFDDIGDSAHLLFTNGAWHFMGGTATLA